MARQDVRSANPGIVPHPAYQTFAGEWQRLLDVYEGGGGFLDDKRPYLYAHPREWLDHSLKDSTTQKWVSNPSPVRPSPKLTARRKIARYENIAATLVDQLAASLFRKPPTRGFHGDAEAPDDHPLRLFWANADGLGRDMGAVLRDNWIAAAVFGHVLLYADRDGQNGDTQADARPVFVRSYTPLDLIDWLTDDMGALTAVRLLEAAERTSLDEPAGMLVSQVRDVTADAWTVRQVQRKSGTLRFSDGDPDTGAHGFGRLPVCVLYAKRRALLPTLGRSVLGESALYIDLYNLTSEVRELLRNQTFAILNIPLGQDGSIEKEMSLIGETSGTANVLFSSQAADYVSPEGTNVQVYHEHIDRLVRTIYRLAVVGWDSDSRDAESAESRKLKKEDLYQMLAGYAAECEQTEMALAELVYRAAYGADGWQKRWDADEPVVSYPDDFDVTGLLDEIEAATQAIALELGETATREVKKRVIPTLLPNLSQAMQQQIDDEIEALDVKTAADQERELMEMRFGQPVLQVPPADPNDVEAVA